MKASMKVKGNKCFYRFVVLLVSDIFQECKFEYSKLWFQATDRYKLCKLAHMVAVNLLFIYWKVRKKANWNELPPKNQSILLLPLNPLLFLLAIPDNSTRYCFVIHVYVYFLVKNLLWRIFSNLKLSYRLAPSITIPLGYVAGVRYGVIRDRTLRYDGTRILSNVFPSSLAWW